MSVTAPSGPVARLSLAVTGHREGNTAFAAHRVAIEQVLNGLFDQIDTAVLAASPGCAPTRLHSMLVDGADQMAMAAGRARGWELVAPVPFGRELNVAINAHPASLADGEALLAGKDAADPATQGRATAIREWSASARLFELVDRDESLTALFRARLRAPDDLRAAQAYTFCASEQVALAAHVLIEQSDLLIGIWDGATTSAAGGTGATIALALDLGTPVLLIDAHAPERWRLCLAPEALAGTGHGPPIDARREEVLVGLLRSALGAEAQPVADKHYGPTVGAAALNAEYWRPQSARFWHGYRRIECLFGADDFRGRFRRLGQVYENPDAIASGSAAPTLETTRALPGQDPAFVERVAADVLRRFAWADGISARLSDTYRGGMILSFLFSGLAISAGIAYLPFATAHEKWIFALVELGLLVAISVITLVGQKRRWHGRWFETRRVAEYLRHAPIMLALGVARPAGRWPKGARTSWPESYARRAIREVGLPQVRVGPAYLRGAVRGLLTPFVTGQRDYHRAKAKRLSRAHHNLDKLSEILFLLAIVSVTSYLVLKIGGHWGLFGEQLASRLSLFLTFLGVVLPTFGAAIAGIRYFGDFERFSAISEVAAERLDAIADRLALLEAAPDAACNFRRVAELVHATDDVVVAEIESWQAVFAGKQVTVPV